MAINDIIRKQAREDAAAALAEDIGDGDLSAGLIDDAIKLSGVLYARAAAVLCGQAWFEACFLHLDNAATFNWQAAEGDDINSNDVLCEVKADAKALLSGERSALNFLQTLSATATVARRLQRLAGDVVVVDTRKTLPKLRVAQKYATRAGGAHNHRQGLFDEILIKENHIAAAGGIENAIARAYKITTARHIQIEARDEQELYRALAAGARRILLDNFSIPALQKAVKQAREQMPTVELEASGGVSEDNIVAIAATGVDRISVGELTKNIRAIDFSFLIN